MNDENSSDLEPLAVDAEVLGKELAEALEDKGYSTLTPVQEAVLVPGLEGKDLRISSQTGSGKTVAIGFVLRDVLATRTPSKEGVARPRVLVIVPTRELAKQVEAELAWLYARLAVRVTSVTGGASYRYEHRALASDPAIVVGTPGRLLDHLQRGSIDGASLGAVVMDEADRMFDMGFQEDLEAIFRFTPDERRTHLVSATFPREVLHLADRVQREPVHVEATPLGKANTDIEHVAHLLDADRRFDALVNLLLAEPDDRTIVFGKTRADVAQVTDDLAAAGFRVAALSGEMEQRERNRAIEGFKKGRVTILVATDVAARGIDVQHVAQVIHLEPPTDSDTYTHRSGRTGRAGNKGRSVMLVTRGDLYRAQRATRQAKVALRFLPLPTASSLRAAQAERVVQRLTADADGAEAPLDERTRAIVERLLAAGSLERVVSRLVAQSGIAGGPAPRDVIAYPPPNERAPRIREPRRPGGGSIEPREAAARAPRGRHAVEGDRGGFDREAPDFGVPHDAPPRRPDSRGRTPRTLPPSGWVAFRVTWGEAHGADVRRLLAMVCRRGGIASSDVGRINVGRYASQLEVSSEVAASFESAARQPDPRDPRVRIERDGAGGAPRAPRAPRFEEGGPPRAPRFEEGGPPRAPRFDDAPPTRGPRTARHDDGPPRKAKPPVQKKAPKR
ncbi:MAG: DEAD/DEAH box helicase [Deltaproteobacteria bacterium]|nr:DEAD/DEAH box helicase [Deltaproteobacteria bacterium]